MVVEEHTSEEFKQLQKKVIAQERTRASELEDELQWHRDTLVDSSLN